MADETMPAVDVQEGDMAEEAVSYECAFHILPTIADEEVPDVVERLKGLITHAGGSVTDEEVSERYELSYEITKQVEGANRRFNTAHFGWMRFTLAPVALTGLGEEIAHMPEILRHLVVRLTREEATKPFSIFEARRAQDVVDAQVATDTVGGSDDMVEGGEESLPTD